MVVATVSKDEQRAAELGLTSNQFAVLKHIRRFRLTTTEATHRFVYPDKSLDAAASAIKRLMQAGFIESATLYPRNRGKKKPYYFMLPSRAETVFGDSPKTAGPLGVAALVERYGVLMFCYRQPSRVKLSPSFFARRYPQLVAKNLPVGNYYGDTDEQGVNRIGFIHVNRAASVERTLHAFNRNVIGKRREHAAWRTEIFARNLFALGIVTGTEEKAKAFREALAESWPNILVRIEVVPEIFRMINRR